MPPPTLRCSLPSSEASVVTSVGPLDLGSGPVGPLVNQDTMARALECFFAQVRTTPVFQMLGALFAQRSLAYGFLVSFESNKAHPSSVCLSSH